MQSSLNMFTTPEHAQRLLSANEHIVRLTLADSLKTSLYVHPAFLKACSSVLRDLLDTELESADSAGSAYYTIPLSDTDVNSWKTVLSMIHPSAKPFKISWSNVMDLLLVAHKYDMPCVTGECSLLCAYSDIFVSCAFLAFKGTGSVAVTQVQRLGQCVRTSGPIASSLGTSS
jgi:hypothetical protein